MAQPFKGTIDVDVRDSEPDGDPYVTTEAPEGTPNVGRIVDYLEESGQLENTIASYCADNGASGEEVQYYAMLGTRAIWHRGWKAVAVHGPTSGIGNVNQDVWHDVRPLDDRTAPELAAVERPVDTSPRDTYVYYPHTLEVPESAAVNVRSRSYRILADVELTDPEAQGVIFAQGSHFGGHALFVKERKLYYVYNFLGIPPEQKFVSDALTPGPHVLGMDFTKDKVGEHGATHGTTRLYVDDQVVAEGPMRTQLAWFALAGEGLCVGRDSSDPVSEEYGPGFEFTGGAIRKVEVDVGDDRYIDLEKETWAMLARE